MKGGASSGSGLMGMKLLRLLVRERFVERGDGRPLEGARRKAESARAGSAGKVQSGVG